MAQVDVAVVISGKDAGAAKTFNKLGQTATKSFKRIEGAAKKTFKVIREVGSKAIGKIKADWEKWSASLAVAGAGLEAVTRNAMEYDRMLNQLVVTTGISKKAFQDQAKTMTDATLSAEELAQLWQRGTQAGAENMQQLNQHAKFYAMLGDATGQVNYELAELGNGMKAFGVDVNNLEDSLGALGYAQANIAGGAPKLLEVTKNLAFDNKELGLSFDSLTAVVGILEDRLGSTEAAERAFGEAAGQAEGDINKFFEVLGVGYQEFSRYRQAITDSAGVLPKLAQENNKNVTIIEQVNAKLQTFVKNNSQLIQLMNQLAPAFIILGGAMAALVPLGGAIATIAAALGTSVAGLAIPLAAAAAAAGLLYVAWSQNWGDIQGMVQSLKDTLAGAFEPVVEKAKVAWDALKTGASAVFETMKEALGPGLTQILDGLLSGFGEAGEGLAGALGGALEAVTAKIQEVTPQIQAAVETIGAFIQRHAPTIVAVIQTAVVTIWTVLKGIFGIVKFVRDVYFAIMKFILGRIGALVQVVAGVVMAIVDAIRGAIPTIVDGVKNGMDLIKRIIETAGEWYDVIKGVMSRIAGAIGSAWEGAKNLVKRGVDFVLDLFMEAVAWYTTIKQIMEDVYGEITGRIGAAVSFVTGKFEAMLNFIKGLKDKFLQAGKDLVKALADGIKSVAGKPAETYESDVLQPIDDMTPKSDAKKGPLSNLTAGGRAIPETVAAGIKEGAPSMEKAYEESLDRVMAAEQRYRTDAEALRASMRRKGLQDDLTELEEQYARELAMATRAGKSRTEIEEKYNKKLEEEHARLAAERDKKETGRLERTKSALNAIQEARIAEFNNFQSLVDGYGQLFAGLGEVAGQFYEQGGQKAKELFEIQKATAVAEAIINAYLAATKAMTAFPPPINYAMAAVTLAKAFGMVAQISAQKPKAMQEGGIVTKATNAIIGEAGPEAVIPLNKAAGFMAGGSVYNITMPIQGGIFTMDPAQQNDLARQLGRPIKDELSRLG